MSDTELNEFWQVEGLELEKERKILKSRKKNILFTDNGKMEVDKKLTEYLSIHSMNLTLSVRQFVER